MHGKSGQIVLDVMASDGVLQEANEAGGISGNQVLAPMPGLVIEVLSNIDDRVNAGDPVAVIEAMKLLQTLTAPCDGVVSQINFIAGESVGSGAVLIEIKPNEFED